MQLPHADGDFLRTTIVSILKELIKTVSGSYISFNYENPPYYLDLKKVIDYDSLIQQRVGSLDNNRLNRYYFDAFARIMECTDVTYVTGFIVGII